jgi:hypothetical protein
MLGICTKLPKPLQRVLHQLFSHGTLQSQRLQKFDVAMTEHNEANLLNSQWQLTEMKGL